MHPDYQLKDARSGRGFYHQVVSARDVAAVYPPREEAARCHESDDALCKGGVAWPADLHGARFREAVRPHHKFDEDGVTSAQCRRCREHPRVAREMGKRKRICRDVLGNAVGHAGAARLFSGRHRYRTGPAGCAGQNRSSDRREKQEVPIHAGYPPFLAHLGRMGASPGHGSPGWSASSAILVPSGCTPQPLFPQVA
jgi:hypothetical protein